MFSSILSVWSECQARQKTEALSSQSLKMLTTLTLNMTWHRTNALTVYSLTTRELRMRSPSSAYRFAEWINIVSHFATRTEEISRALRSQKRPPASGFFITTSLSIRAKDYMKKGLIWRLSITENSMKRWSRLSENSSSLSGPEPN